VSDHLATVSWRREGARFVDNRYSRAHRWEFDGGAVVPASASPHLVPVPLSDPAGVDPEEAFVASIASCHMLFFLSFAAKRGLVVESYRDEAAGTLGKDGEGRLAMTVVTLRPHVVFSGEPPAREVVEEIHHAAHEACFIATSVKTEIRTEPTFEMS
jgi:organic hydroperoxide reductase OsmC/OhrA